VPVSVIDILGERETLFISIIDEPDRGYYWYILEVQFVNEPAVLQVTQNTFSLRSLSAQVVKQ